MIKRKIFIFFSLIRKIEYLYSTIKVVFQGQFLLEVDKSFSKIDTIY
jgi:hypothetical protein